MSDTAIRVENLSKMYPSTPLRTGLSTEFIPSELVLSEAEGAEGLSAGLRDALVAGLRAPLERLRRNVQFVSLG